MAKSLALHIFWQLGLTVSKSAPNIFLPDVGKHILENTAHTADARQYAYQKFSSIN